MKGRYLKKLKSILPITSLKQGRILHLNASDGLLDPFPLNSDRVLHSSSVCSREQDQNIDHNHLPVPKPDIIDISELMSDDEDGEMQSGDDDSGDKENIGPPVKHKDPVPVKDNSDTPISSDSCTNSNLRNGPLLELDVSSFRRLDPLPIKDNSESITRNPRSDHQSEIDISSFRRPDLNSTTLFDPNLLAAFEQAVMDHIHANKAERRVRIEKENLEKDEESPSKALQIQENPLSGFEEKCPPGGSASVILYSTSLRGIRKTFEDCNSIRFLLDSFRIVFYERDVSMHLEYREELWTILGGRVVPPRLFIKGRYIGGADEVVGLHEQGKLRQLLQGIQLDQSNGPCAGCAGIRFVLCFNCNGSRKVIPNDGEDNEFPIRCSNCNENGLIICPLCC